jgi:hypothetical protein
MKKNLTVVILLAFITCSSGCMHPVMESDDILQFKVDRLAEDKLRMTGLVYSSLGAAGRFKTKQEGDDLLVTIRWFTATKHRSGNFDYVVHVPLGVRRVLFGNKRIEIWQRQ